jgi:hypothetical protein
MAQKRVTLQDLLAALRADPGDTGRKFASTGSRDAGSLGSNAEQHMRRSGSHYLYPTGGGRYSPEPPPRRRKLPLYRHGDTKTQWWT